MIECSEMVERDIGTIDDAIEYMLRRIFVILQNIYLLLYNYIFLSYLCLICILYIIHTYIPFPRELIKLCEENGNKKCRVKIYAPYSHTLAVSYNTMSRNIPEGGFSQFRLRNSAGRAISRERSARAR